MGESKARGARYAFARDRARAVLFLSRQQPPVDVDAIIEGAHVPVVERALDPDVRTTVGDVAGRRAIILSPADGSR